MNPTRTHRETPETTEKSGVTSTAPTPSRASTPPPKKGQRWFFAFDGWATASPDEGYVLV
jgi:hypothetical protein